MVRRTKKNITAAQLLKFFLCGMLIGGGGILPGVSGGVLCVLFGIYRPMMALFARPINTMKTHYRMFVPVFIGGVVGFVLFANVLENLFERNELYVTWVFIGLIAGEIPTMFKDAGKNGRTKSDIAALGIAFAVILAIMVSVKYLSRGADIKPNFWWFVFCGAAWGLSIVVPGMTSSALLMSLGLYMPLTAGVASFDFSILIPWAIGLASSILVCSKGVNALFEKKYSLASHSIVGIVAAFAVLIIPVKYIGIWQLIICLVLFAAGFCAAYLINGIKVKDKEQ